MSTRPNDTTAKNRLGDQIDQTMHRLLSLEMALSSMSKSNRLGLKNTEARIKAIRALQMELHRTQHLIGASKQDLGSVPIDQLVPALAQCTPMEQTVYESFATERHRVLDALATQIIQLKSWVRTSHGSWFTLIKTTLRLSKIARIVSMVDRWLKNVEQENFRVDTLIRKAIHQLNSRVENDPLPSTIEGLIKIFNELDTAAGDITSLREKIRTEEQMIIRMRAWLHQEEKLLNMQPMPAPSIETIRQAQAEIRDTTLDPLDKTKQRLVLAQRFVDEFAGLDPVVESFIGKAVTQSPKSGISKNIPVKARVG